MFTPAAVLRLWFCGLLSVVAVALSIFLVSRWYQELPQEKVLIVQRGSDSVVDRRTLNTAWERIGAWRPRADKTSALLASACALLTWSTFGRFLSARFLRRRGPHEPQRERDGETRIIQRPDGSSLQVESYGPTGAQNIILIHGWGCDSTIWYYLRRRLSERFRVIVWDLPGLGRSTGPANRDYTLEKMASDLRAIIDTTGTKPVLLGHSIGGMIILTLFRLFPDLVHQGIAGVVLTNTTYTNPLRTMAFSKLLTVMEKPLIVPLLHLTIWLSPLVRVLNWLSYLNGSTHWSTEWEAFAGTETRGQLDFAANYSVRTSPAVFARGALGMLRYDASRILPEIDIPVLVIAGDKDPVTSPAASRHIEAHIPASRFYQLSPAKHLALLEQHKQFGEVVEQFVSSVQDQTIKTAGYLKKSIASDANQAY